MTWVAEAITATGFTNQAAPTEHRRRAGHPADGQQVVARAASGTVGAPRRRSVTLDGADAGRRGRLTARRDDMHGAHQAVGKLLPDPAARLRWARVISLEGFDRVPRFAAPPSP